MSPTVRIVLWRAFPPLCAPGGNRPPVPQAVPRAVPRQPAMARHEARPSLSLNADFSTVAARAENRAARSTIIKEPR